MHGGSEWTSQIRIGGNEVQQELLDRQDEGGDVGDGDVNVDGDDRNNGAGRNEEGETKSKKDLAYSA